MRKIFESENYGLDGMAYTERVIVYEFESEQEWHIYDWAVWSSALGNIINELGLPYNWHPAPGEYFERTEVDVTYSHLIATVRGTYNV